MIQIPDLPGLSTGFTSNTILLPARLTSRIPGGASVHVGDPCQTGSIGPHRVDQASLPEVDRESDPAVLAPIRRVGRRCTREDDEAHREREGQADQPPWDCPVPSVAAR
jgi:hypothetical protein